MNRKIYWKIRKRILNILFRYKVFTYKSISRAETTKDYTSFGLNIVKKAVLGIIKGIVIAIILLDIDKIILKAEYFSHFENTDFVNIIIGCLGVAGVILGLYCANISSIYSSKYANAPESVSNAFQHDSLTQKCVSMIIDYIIFSFIIITEILIGCTISWGTAFTIIFWSILVIISYSVAGNRAYQLSNVYRVADDSYRLLFRTVINNLNRNIYSNDASFQNHFEKIGEQQIIFLNEVQRFGENSKENSNAAMVQFMWKNIVLVESYWKIKQEIARNSYWFRNTEKYQKWHLANHVEISNAIRTGTWLRTKVEHDYWWFEDNILLINQKCLAYLCKNNDYLSLYTYLSYFKSMCKIAVDNKEALYISKQINYLRELIEKLSNHIDKQDKENSKTFTGVVESILLLYLNVVIESCKYYTNFNIKKNISVTIRVLDKGKSLSKCKILRGKENIDFYSKIITEVQTEGKRLTPDWLVEQNIAMEAYKYMNILEDIVRKGMDSIFKLGQEFYDKKLLYEACIISMRFYEYESKLSNFIEIVELKEKELFEYHIDQGVVWEESNIKILKETIKKWKNTIPPLLLKCSSEFVINIWEIRNDYPDILGECYNHICEDAINAIIQNNSTQFQIDFENLSKLMLLYQEYIRTDFLKNRDVYRVQFVYYMFTSPMIEWAQIGGLAILWGEFNLSSDWRNIVDATTAAIFSNDTEDLALAEKFVEYIQHRNKLRVGFAHRDFLETGWQQKVAQAIKQSDLYQTEHEMFSRRLKTKSKLLKAFCENFDTMGFTIDPSEVYLVLCINPMLSDEKKFHTSYSWEERMND